MTCVRVMKTSSKDSTPTYVMCFIHSQNFNSKIIFARIPHLLQNQISDMQLESSQLEKSMQNRHLSVGQFSEIELSSRVSSAINSTAMGQNDPLQPFKSHSAQFEGYVFIFCSSFSILILSYS